MRRERATGIQQQAKSVALADEQAVAPVVREIDDAHRAVVGGGVAEDGNSRVGECDLNAVRQGLLQFERQPGLRVFAALERGDIARSAGLLGEDGLVFLEFLRCFIRAAEAQENLAQAIVRGGMVRLKLDGRLQLE